MIVPPLSRRPVRSLVRMRGQSTVELIVAALVLTPMFLVIPLLGKYLDMMQTAEQASRYLAFEATVPRGDSRFRSDAELAGDVRRRLLGTSSAPIKTADVAGDFDAHRNPLWTDPFGRPLIRKFNDDISVNSSIEAKNVLPVIADYANGFGFDRSNLYTGSVTIRPHDVAQLASFDKIGLSITRRTAILVDPWASRGPDQTRDRYRSAGVLINPSATADPLGLINLVGQLPTLLLDPAFKVDDFDWDVVPQDRLK